ncbi:hypothetical protein FC756_09095 [Lysinibacillus mangiferihumi]|uniref:Uncharacterized protein n=1 Tax=Lysinibacillus mangiferihumi TaxID=1130819 RepID=A0A4U2Z5A1_9BACI|nr:hypothetical protein [Lysinibacillus mangiferihumi]TKI69466.1 hypothetical protein FC756_09095 [Lysinibacillus mangiferihumi]
MQFNIITDTASSKVGELASELRNHLKPRIHSKYANVDVTILVGFRCLPESYKRKSFIRYTKKDNCLAIDISVKLEDYIKMHKIEQRYHLGNIFIEYLRKALKERTFEGLDNEEFIDDIIKWGKEIPIKMDCGPIKVENWFRDEIDWSSDLDK